MRLATLAFLGTLAAVLWTAAFSAPAALAQSTAAMIGAEVEGATLTLSYDEALNTAHVPAASRFTVSGTASATTVTAAAFKTGSRVLVELTLSPAVAASDTGITVSYAKGDDANPLQDLLGHSVRDFSGESVTNVTGAPTLRYARVNGSTLALVFSEAMDTTKIPSTSRFTVAGTESAVSVTGARFYWTEFGLSSDTRLELTLSAAVARGNTGITVSYAKGTDANPLQDPVGNALADFSGQQVVNETGVPIVQSATVNGATLTLTFTEPLYIWSKGPPPRRASAWPGPPAPPR